MTALAPKRTTEQSFNDRPRFAKRQSFRPQHRLERRPSATHDPRVPVEQREDVLPQLPRRQVRVAAEPEVFREDRTKKPEEPRGAVDSSVTHDDRFAQRTSRTIRLFERDRPVSFDNAQLQ